MNKDLAVRTITALILLLITFSIFKIWETTGLMFFGLIILIIGAMEYADMFLKKNKPLFILFFSICTLSPPLFYLYSTTPIIYISLFLFSLITFIFLKNENDPAKILNNISILFLGYFYTIVCPFFLFKIIVLESIGLKLFFSVLLITFSCDIFAYIFGRAFGRKLLLPLVSPKKTYAGAFGGLLASTSLAYVTLTYSFQIFPPAVSLLIGLCCGLATQSGDFFASLLKRVAGVKDAGKIMPGHGGVLDRFDGLYFSGPVFYVFYYFLKIN